MFNKNTNFLLPSPSNGTEILLQQHEMLYANYLSTTTNASSLLESSSSFNLEASSSVINTCPKKQTVKKDRHSKIQTAQGPRDRRVRLSIGIARKFFDLQELLGFDKPSKTLDWLLTKSKTAIKDLVQSKQRSEVEDLENGKRKSGNKVKEGQDSQANLAKESRVKARARARERTREKMCIKQINETRNTSYDLSPSNIPIQYMNNQLQFCKISGYEACSQAGQIEESVVIRKRVAKNPSVFGFQQNPYPYSTAAENWDISSVTQSNMFVNRSNN